MTRRRPAPPVVPVEALVALPVVSPVASAMAAMGLTLQPGVRVFARRDGGRTLRLVYRSADRSATVVNTVTLSAAAFRTLLGAPR